MLLAIEMSGGRNTLALSDGTDTATKDFSDQRGKGLMPALVSLLEDAASSREALRGIVVGTGPGSYTGLRIACSAGIMLGYALDIPCGGLCSFTAAAFAADHQEQDLHLALDAYRKEVYHACYRRIADDLQVVVPPRVLPRAEVAPAIGDRAFLGDPELAPHGRCLAPDCQPDAADLLQFALAKGAAPNGRRFAVLEDVEPLYLRPAAFRRPSA